LCFLSHEYAESLLRAFVNHVDCHLLFMIFRISGFVAMLLLLSACEQQGGQTVRGTATVPDTSAPVVPQAEQPARSVIEETIGLPEQDSSTEEKSEIHLNLSLPEMEWDDAGELNDDRLLPDVFGARPDDPVLNWSGRVFLDDSDEARDRPMMDTITGAEVEIRVKTH